MPFTFTDNTIQRLYWGLAVLMAVCLGVSFVVKETSFIYIPFAVLAALFVFFYDIKVLFFLLLFFIPFSIEYSVTSSLSTDLPDEPMMLAMAGCAVLYMVYRPSLIKNFAGHPLIQLLFLQLIWIFITIFFSYDKVVSIKYLLAKGWYILAFVFGPALLVKKKKDFVLIGLCYCIPMLILMCWTLYNHVMRGLTFDEANHVMQPFFRNHVNYSALLVCIMPILYLFHYFTKSHKKLVKQIMIFTLIGIFFSYARGAWLALITGVLFVYVLRKKLLKQALVIATVAILSVVALLIYNDNYTKFAPDFNTTVFHSDFGEHLVATYQLKDVSNAERFYRWIAGVRMSVHEPITGYGPNNFYDHYKQYTDPRFKTWVSANEDHSSVHNYFLLLLIEQGIPGLIIFSALLYSMFMYVQRLYYRIKDEFYRQVTMVIGVILTMITTVILLSDLIETDKIGGLFFVCLGLLVVIDLKTREESNGIIPA